MTRSETVEARVTAATSHAPMKYVFVGAFKATNDDGSSGGQVVACRTLVDSPISKHVQWSKVDTTMISVPPPSGPKRAVLAAQRFMRFGAALPGSDGALIFTSARMSFVEKGLMALVSRTLGKRVVLCPRSGLILDDVEGSTFMRWYVPFVLKHVDIVVCQGESWQRRFRELAGVAPESLVVVPNWMDFTSYEEVASARPQRDGPATFLYLGWLESYKGIFNLLEAVASQRAALVGARFVVCGQGRDEAGARARAKDLGMDDLVEFRGWVSGPNKIRALEEADALVLPSHREGMPNVLLEAMAAGLPVVATDVGGIPDVIGSDGRFGLLVAPRAPDELAEALIQMSRDPKARHRMGRAGREHVIQNHDIRNLWRRILTTLEDERGAAEAR